MKQFEVIFGVFLLPTAVAWYCFRKDLIYHVVLLFLYALAIACLLYYAGGPIVVTGHDSEETIRNVFTAYGHSGGSITGALIGAGLGWALGEFAFERSESG